MGDHPKRWTAKSLRTFILDRANRHGRARVKLDVTAVRMFVRYLIAVGRCAPDLDQAIPTIARWRLSSLPEYLLAEEVERVIASCDLRTPIGVRDRAVLLLLSRLGLRAGDVASLQLTDIDWDDAHCTGCWQKPQGPTITPLPRSRRCHLVLSGAASSGDCSPGLCHHDGAAQSSGAPIDRQNRRLCHATRRVEAPMHGSHVLRHSAATEMLRQGLSLRQLAWSYAMPQLRRPGATPKLIFHCSTKWLSPGQRRHDVETSCQYLFGRAARRQL